MDNPIAVITPSAARRWVSVAFPMLLGVIVVYSAFATPPATFLLQLFLLAVGFGALLVGEKMRRATALTITMTKDRIYDSSGQELCKLDDITGIDRGSFAFKPANGFLLRIDTKLGRSWSPGLWWRIGHRIGVGGATPAGQGKFMAEAIAMHIAMKEQGSA